MCAEGFLLVIIKPHISINIPVVGEHSHHSNNHLGISVFDLGHLCDALKENSMMTGRIKPHELMQ